MQVDEHVSVEVFQESLKEKFGESLKVQLKLLRKVQKLSKKLL